MNVLQDRNKCKAVVKTVLDIRVSRNAGNSWTGWGTVRVWRRALILGVCSVGWLVI